MFVTSLSVLALSGARADVSMATPMPQARAGALNRRRPRPTSGSTERDATCAIKAVPIKLKPPSIPVVVVLLLLVVGASRV